MSGYYMKVVEHGIKKDLIYNNESVLKYSIKYPQFTTPELSFFIGRLNRYYTGTAQALSHYCEQTLYWKAVELYQDFLSKSNLFFHTFELDSVYTVTYNENCVLSLYFDKYQYEGGANGVTYRSADNWNLLSGNKIALHKLFPAQKDFSDYIEKEINNQIAEQLKNNTGYYFDDYERLVAENLDSKNYYITENAVNIFFQEITISPHSSGIIVFTFPFNDSQATKPKCNTNTKSINTQNTITAYSDNETNAYKIRSTLLMDAANEVGALTPKQSASIWADGLKERSAALQYIVMTKSLKKRYAISLEKNNPNWVTGVSSPWVEGYSFLEQKELNNGSYLFKIQFDMSTSTGHWGSYFAETTIIKEQGFWRIDNIHADKQLNVYMGD